MTDFKVGDRVRWTRYPEYGTGIVLKMPVPYDPNAVTVRFDKFSAYDDAEGLDYHSPKIEDLELVETALARQAREYREVLEADDEPTKGPHEPFVEAIKSFKFEDDVNHPAHYNSGKIEVWDFIYDQGLGYALGNAVKYISRSGKKAGNSKVKDLRKAIAFLEREIRFEETGE